MYCKVLKFIVPLHPNSELRLNNSNKYTIMEQKKLTRSTDKMVAGVCAGLAEYMGIDPTVVRVVYAALSIFSAGFPGLILYLVLMILMPNKE